MNGPTHVKTRIEEIVFSTYLPAPPDRNPMFLEKRVYQGSSGRVYPLPFTDRIAEKPVNRKWRAVWIENKFLRVLVLPELGGRIHVLQDKMNGYDLIYHQRVIKPALVGLAGPWISGGIEFNWPQHHRPATFLPVDYEIEHHADGSATVWCSQHDPLTRMKEMHGVCLHPGRAVLELKVRACNRTPLVQTFLWWANVATRVHKAYQSFFPPDVYCVADHARRSVSEYPLAQGFYYGVDYGKRGRKGIPPNEIPRQFVPPHCHDHAASGVSDSKLLNYAPNDLSFYANIPTPCSYMCTGSREDFFGGYDYNAQAGIIHIANHRLAPGKKQWTWGNHDFGYAWDRHLTDADENGVHAPYIELMAGVYTDNQPDFSFLQPGETKTWSQFWYPIREIGPAQHANLDAAISLRILQNGDKQRATPLWLGISVTRKFRAAKILLLAGTKTLLSFRHDLAPDKPVTRKITLPRGIAETDLLIRVLDSTRNEIIAYQPKPRVNGKASPPAAEPPAPTDIAGNDELFLTGLHLEQYRHATRSPTLYWHEALHRDPLDSRCNNALGLWHFKRGEFAKAESYFRKAIERLTRRNANPYDGEAFYNLGLTLRQLGRDGEAYDAIYKACWNQAWMAAGYHALAEIDCCRSDWPTALEHLNRSLRFDTDNLRARNLKALVLRRLHRNQEAKSLLCETLALDPLDWWARYLNGEKLECDLQTMLDLAHDFARAGFFAEAIELLKRRASTLSAGNRREANPALPLPDQNWGARPMVFYTLGWLHEKVGDRKAALGFYRRAAAETPDYCFPSRLEEIAILESAMHANPRDPRAPYYLGNLLYDRRRHEEAIGLWKRSAKLNAGFSIVWRNLGIGYFNVLKDSAKARSAYERAFRANPTDARLLFERDQLWKRLGEVPDRRLHALEKHPHLVSRRDDLTVEFCALLNQTGQHNRAMQLLATRNFQPWEGGEGAALSQYIRTQLALGRKALAITERDSASRSTADGCGFPTRARAAVARKHFEAALTPPLNLGETKHLLANQSDIHYWLGIALDLLGDRKSACQHWQIAARFKGDFQEMNVRAFSEMTFYSARSLEKLGRQAEARKLFRDLLTYAIRLQTAEAKIDYFATSLPTMLLFEDDLQFRQETTALFLQAQAQVGLGDRSAAKKLLTAVLKRNPNHMLAADVWSEYFQRENKA